MKFLVMHKNDPHTEAGELPGPELMQQMGAFIGEHVAKGTFLDGAGLRGSATRTRLTFRDGATTAIQHGPYAGGHELPNHVLTLVVKTRDEAIGWAERYGKLLGDGELELGALTEPWDLGVMPKPADAPLRLLLIEKADAASEAGARSPKLKAELTRLKTEMKKAGVLGGEVALAPSARGKRLQFRANELAVFDGPFAESKELIGGYSILALADFDTVIAECRRYAKILGGTLEIDVRVVVDEP